MTRSALQRWPQIADERRAVIAGRAAEGGGACTLIVIREPDGRRLLSFEGAWRTCAELNPDAHAALVRALTELVRWGVSTNRERHLHHWASCNMDAL